MNLREFPFAQKTTGICPREKGRLRKSRDDQCLTDHNEVRVREPVCGGDKGVAAGVSVEPLRDMRQRVTGLHDICCQAVSPAFTDTSPDTGDRSVAALRSATTRVAKENVVGGSDSGE